VTNTDGSTVQKYSCNLIFSAETEEMTQRLLAPNKAPGQVLSITELMKLITDEVMAEFASDKPTLETWTRPDSTFKKCFASGESPQVYDKVGYGKGTVYLKLSSNRRPTLANQFSQVITDESELYPGCYVRAKINIKAYSKSLQTGRIKGVAAYINGIQKVKDGDRIGASDMNVNEFAPLESPEFGATENAYGSIPGFDI
jgi:hypothetical protein